MAKHHVMDASGHSTIEFDPKNTTELSEAMKRFKALTGDGFTAAVRKEGERDYKVTRTFDPSADTETLFVPAMQGGGCRHQCITARRCSGSKKNSSAAFQQLLRRQWSGRLLIHSP